MLRAQIAEQSTTIDDVVRALPLFTALQGGTQPSTMIHEGVDAIHGYFAHLEKIHPDAIDEIVNIEDVYAWNDANELRRARASYNWQPKHARALFMGTLKNRNPKFEHRVLNKAWGTFRGNLAIYGSFVSVLTYTNKPILIIIESKALADSLRLLFGIAWRASDDPK